MTRRKSLCVLVLLVAIQFDLPTALSVQPTEPPDSFRYYGPGGLRDLWDRDDWQPHRLGRDTWIFWTWGNQKFLRFGAKQLANQPLPISLDLFRLLDSRNRDQRFKTLGLINEPNCSKATQPDKFGFWLDVWTGDPEHYYPGESRYNSDASYDTHQHYPGTTEVVDTRNYGRPSGIIGLRVFDNPKFTDAMKKAWDPKRDVKRYFESPGKVEPPYLVGFTCALCHMGFDPTNPPLDKEHPRWRNLAANIGNQYLREGELIFTTGRVLFGDRRPGANYVNDPYDTKGLGPDDFLYHYAATQQPGTSETSRISYDFINNPNTMNPIFNLGSRRLFLETNPNGKTISTMHILKDGADSIGVEWALMRVPINIGCEGVYWSDSLYNPFSGARQHPFDIAEALHCLPAEEKKKITSKYGVDFSGVSQSRIESLERRYHDDFGQEFGQDWAEAWKRNRSLAAYLESYRPFYLKDAPGGTQYLSNVASISRGQVVFAQNCAMCHSSKQPESPDDLANPSRFFEQLVKSPDFLKNNTLSDDVRYSVMEPKLGTNMARAIATNAIDGDIWAEFSSRDYKNLAGVTRTPVVFQVPVFEGQKPISVSFRAPSGGRGYYRTPSLVSMWATAPYFHNNSLGTYTEAVSVDERISAFEDGVDQLLWPEKRPTAVKRVGQDCSLFTGILQALPKLLTDRLLVELHEQLAAKGPRQIADGVVRDLRPVIERVLAKFMATSKDIDLNEMQTQMPMILEQELAKAGLSSGISDDAKELLKAKLLDRLRQDINALQAAFRKNSLVIPKGTPINLYLNLNISSLPYAILAHLQYRTGSREWAEALLQLSDCPDLVENKGHTYGTDLTDAEKKDLKEYLKTL